MPKNPPIDNPEHVKKEISKNVHLIQFHDGDTGQTYDLKSMQQWPDDVDHDQIRWGSEGPVNE
jgi:hypothetical protein